MLPEGNYVRLQPTLPEGKIYNYTGCSYEDNEELCDIACQYLA